MKTNVTIGQAIGHGLIERPSDTPSDTIGHFDVSAGRTIGQPSDKINKTSHRTHRASLDSAVSDGGNSNGDNSGIKHEETGGRRTAPT
jgi:hypothetical protein